MSTKKELQILETRFKAAPPGDRLNSTELERLCKHLISERDQVTRWFEQRREVEDKAHGLFTSPMPSGLRFMHSPGQCNPLGFVQVLRQAIQKLQATIFEDRQLLRILLITMKQWRQNWNSPQRFETQDIDQAIERADARLKQESIPNPFVPKDQSE